ncbi:MAG: lipoate--protein ligase [Acholeplasmataceae bacterium]
MILIKHHNEGKLKPYFYFALEEYAMKELLSEDKSFFFTWEIEGVVVGKNQVIENEVNLAYCKEQGIDIYRRPTGGGCVYADEKNTMFSMITAKKNESFSFKPYLMKIVDAMKALNIDIEFSGRNDLLYEGKKISGNAFLQNKYGMLMHGTFLYNCDLETMVRSISPSDEKLISKGISSVRSRVTNMKPFLSGMSQEELIQHFNEFLTENIYELTPEDVEKVNELAKKYEDPSFIYKKQPLHTKVLKARIPGGMFEINLNIKHGNIEKMTVQGDFFDVNPLDGFEVKFDGVPYEKSSLEKVLADIDISEYVLDANNEAFLELLLTGIIAPQ